MMLQLWLAHQSVPPYIPTVKFSAAYRDALAIQRLVARDAKSEEVGPKERCLLARAFKELEELKLRLRMKPAPKPVDVTKIIKPRGSARGDRFTETEQEGA